MGAPKPLVPVIVGPTAVGKTAVALALAQHWPLVVISADSRQVYRRLDIGTAKPTAAECARVEHLGIDLIEPGERYSAGRFAADAAGWLSAIEPERQPAVVGGTGFYIRALADGLFNEPAMSADKRAELRAWAAEAEGLGRWAARLDADYTAGGRQRATRAVEVALLTGRSLSWWQRHAKAEGVMRPWFVRLTVPRQILHRRIEARTEAMLQQGLVEEVRTLLDEGIPADAPGLDAVGYREVVAHIEGELAAADLPEAITIATRRYAKRQETWFRHQLADPVLALDATDAPETVARRIVESWAERER